jgi:hypothetical protein
LVRAVATSLLSFSSIRSTTLNEPFSSLHIWVPNMHMSIANGIDPPRDVLDRDVLVRVEAAADLLLTREQRKRVAERHAQDGLRTRGEVRRIEMSDSTDPRAFDAALAG